MSGLASLGRGKMTNQVEGDEYAIIFRENTRHKKLVDFTTLFTEPQLGCVLSCVEQEN